MSNFVNGLVRRGAGLPLPMMVRPSLSPRNVPVALEPHPASLDPSSAGSPGESTQPPAVGPLIVDSASPSAVRAQTFPQIPTPEPFVRSRLPGRSPLETKEALEIPDEAPAAAPPITQQITVLDENRPALHPSPNHQSPKCLDKTATAPKPVAITALLPPASQGHDATKPGHARDSDAVMRSEHGRRSSGDPRRQATPAVGPTRVPPRQEAASLAVSVRQARAVAPKKEAGARSEPRNIQVKIGRVEIRTSQPAPPVRATGKKATGGFADLKLARAHLDRGGW
jgi:hypothetical protein